MGMCKWFFRDATKIQNSRQMSTLNFFVGAKTLKLKVRNYSNFTITFPMIWRCAGDFFKVLLIFKMAATDQLWFFLWAQKLQNLKSEIIQILLSHSPRYGDVQGIFLRFYWNSKWPPWINFIFFCWRKNWKIEISYVVQSHYPPSGNVHMMRMKFKMATKNRLFKYLWPQKV